MSRRVNKNVMPQPWGKKALVAREKHGTRVFDASTEEALHASALALLKERMDTGYYYHEPIPPALPALTLEQLNALPDGKIKQAGHREWRDREEAVREYERERRGWLDMVKALEEKDGKLAWSVLRSRYDCEYEYVELVTLEGGCG